MAKVLLDKFNNWMGHGRKSWYTGLEIGEDSAEGLELRQQLADAKCEEKIMEFMEKAKVPIKFKPVVRHCTRKSCADKSFYNNLMNPIGETEWLSFWGKVN